MSTTGTFNQALAAYRDWIGMSTEPGDPPSRGRGRPRRTQQIVVAGDFHVPFHSRAALKALVREEANHTDLLVINGDLMDAWSTSRYPKSRRLVDPCSELAEAQAVLSLLAGHFRSIRIIAGNHDCRPSKYLIERLPPEILDYIRETGPMVFRPLEFIAAGLKNVQVVEPIKSGFAEFAFIHQVGDLVCTHAESYSKIPNRASGNVNLWIHSFALPEKIVQAPVRCIVQAHTHQGGSVMGDFGTLCIEGGCMSDLQEYHGSARISTPRPLARGWSRIYQTGGVTDIRESRFIPFVG